MKYAKVVYKMLLLPNYRVKYYDQIIAKWCNGIACKLVCIAGYCFNFNFNNKLYQSIEENFGISASKCLEVAVEVCAYVGGCLHASVGACICT